MPGNGLPHGVRSWPKAGIKPPRVKSDERKAHQTSHGSQVGRQQMRGSMRSNSTSLEASGTSELSENDAVRLAQAGDSEGFGRLYQLHSRRVYALCMHM